METKMFFVLPHFIPIFQSTLPTPPLKRGKPKNGQNLVHFIPSVPVCIIALAPSIFMTAGSAIQPMCSSVIFPSIAKNGNKCVWNGGSSKIV